MDKHDTLRKINEMLNYGIKLSIDLIESEARKILSNDKDLDEFIMGMGEAFFTFKKGGKYDIDAYSDEQLQELEEKEDPLIDFIYGTFYNIIHSEKFQEDFFELIEYLEDRFNVKAYSMRFTAKGPIKRDW